MQYVDTIIQGDALEVLRTLAAESIDCCITSPPYWGLRDYGVSGQLGLEPDFRDYITKLADTFDEVKRVLKRDGTCWVNLGDSYLNDSPVRSNPADQWNPNTRNQPVLKRSAGGTRKSAARVGGVKQKSLVQVPSRFAIEMIDRGWILRNEIIWHKPNCMPSSVRDRFTVDFEKLFFFTKSKRYYFERQAENAVAKRRTANRNRRSVWTIATKPFRDAHFAVFPEELVETPMSAGCPPSGIVLDPFMGAGTTALVARRLVRHFVGVELNGAYIEIARRRIAQTTATRYHSSPPCRHGRW